MNKILVYFLLLILAGCSGFNPSNSSYKLSHKELVCDEIFKKAVIDHMVKTGLEPCGTGSQMLERDQHIH